MNPCIALLGGSFDPVHHGHVALAALFADLLHPDQLRILPARPWQKSSLLASDAQRVAMLELAFAHQPFAVTIDLQEIERGSATYTVETLRALRAELNNSVGGEASIVFVMGADQLQKLDSWRDWQALFDLTNLGVAARPGYELDQDKLPPAVAAALADRLATPAQVRASPYGKVCLAHTLAVDISATQVRNALRTGEDISALLPSQVLDYIQQHNLYRS
ncbi:nicotinate (nicotinamide) nucleotide adenylyltransferase [Massilia sp. 9I]|uniref:nicotinate (nicotinamide) nucleotide adenylyltransferase n=1 Tax=Massilia sp. 9I TaxID=2653152 RepID=UPI0012EF69FF|nr:nicotinate (nicotinamide) nucleotide adenylyltransferase [Massilia sp. 9I]VXC59134.1 putative nicotinate-nucleotide adenylyltransferase [Massilia sp. 9I]